MKKGAGRCFRVRWPQSCLGGAWGGSSGKHGSKVLAPGRRGEDGQCGCLSRERATSETQESATHGDSVPPATPCPRLLRLWLRASRPEGPAAASARAQEAAAGGFAHGEPLWVPSHVRRPVRRGCCRVPGLWGLGPRCLEGVEGRGAGGRVREGDGLCDFGGSHRCSH